MTATDVQDSRDGGGAGCVDGEVFLVHDGRDGCGVVDGAAWAGAGRQAATAVGDAATASPPSAMAVPAVAAASPPTAVAVGAAATASLPTAVARGATAAIPTSLEARATGPLTVGGQPTQAGLPPRKRARYLQAVVSWPGAAGTAGSPRPLLVAAPAGRPEQARLASGGFGAAPSTALPCLPAAATGQDGAAGTATAARAPIGEAFGSGGGRGSRPDWRVGQAGRGDSRGDGGRGYSDDASKDTGHGGAAALRSDNELELVARPPGAWCEAVTTGGGGSGSICRGIGGESDDDDGAASFRADIGPMVVASLPAAALCTATTGIRVGRGSVCRGVGGVGDSNGSGAVSGVEHGPTLMVGSTATLRSDTAAVGVGTALNLGGSSTGRSSTAGREAVVPAPAQEEAAVPAVATMADAPAAGAVLGDIAGGQGVGIPCDESWDVLATACGLPPHGRAGHRSAGDKGGGAASGQAGDSVGAVDGVVAAEGGSGDIGHRRRGSDVTGGKCGSRGHSGGVVGSSGIGGSHGTTGRGGDSGGSGDDDDGGSVGGEDDDCDAAALVDDAPVVVSGPGAALRTTATGVGVAGAPVLDGAPTGRPLGRGEVGRRAESSAEASLAQAVATGLALPRGAASGAADGNAGRRFPCNECSITFTRMHDVRRHVRSVHRGHQHGDTAPDGRQLAASGGRAAPDAPSPALGFVAASTAAKAAADEAASGVAATRAATGAAVDGASGRFLCTECPASFARADTVQRHRRRAHRHRQHHGAAHDGHLFVASGEGAVPDASSPALGSVAAALAVGAAATGAGAGAVARAALSGAAVVGASRRFRCIECSREFTSDWILQQHGQRVHRWRHYVGAAHDGQRRVVWWGGVVAYTD